MESKSIDPSAPLRRINLPAYQNTIKRLRSESNWGQNGIDFGGHKHTLKEMEFLAKTFTGHCYITSL